MSQPNWLIPFSYFCLFHSQKKVMLSLTFSKKNATKHFSFIFLLSKVFFNKSNIFKPNGKIYCHKNNFQRVESVILHWWSSSMAIE